MIDEIYPSVGMAGSYICNAPFNTFISPQLRYICVAVESLQGMVAEGKDPLETIYIKYSLGEGLYKYDLERNIKVLTLQAASGDLFKVPQSFIVSMPDPNGVKYDLVMLGISLSAIPETLDLEVLKTEIKDLVFQRIGVVSEVKEVIYGVPNILTQAEHQSVEASRLSKVSSNNSNLRRIQELTTTIERLTERLRMLEDYITTHMVS